MRKFTKAFFLILFSGASTFFLYRFCHAQTDGFSLSKIRKAFIDQTIPHKSSSISLEEKEKVKKILNQPLSYIGRGGQCYAFATADGQYVIKLLKYNNNYPRIWFRLFPFPFNLENYRQRELSRKFKKLEKEYESYGIALEYLKEETGILYSHFDQGDLPGVMLELFDKIKVHHFIPADLCQFYIQKKGTALYPGIKKLVDSGLKEDAIKALDNLATYLIRRSQKKIIDKDNGIWRNFAFYRGQPFQIDIGQFVYNPSFSSEAAKENLLLFTEDFRNWLKALDPSLEEYFANKLKDFD